MKDEADTTFISEVFSGCVRYQGLIKVLHVCMFLADFAHVRLQLSLLSCMWSHDSSSMGMIRLDTNVTMSTLSSVHHVQ